MKIIAVSLFALPLTQFLFAANPLTIASEAEWKGSIIASKGVVIRDGVAEPTGKTGTLRTKIHNFDQKRSASSLVIRQSPIWQNWSPIANLGPSNLRDAPVLLTVGPDNYWMFGRYSSLHSRGQKGGKSDAGGRLPLPGQLPFRSEPVKLENFDIPLMTTPDENQFNAPGGLKKGRGGYHAWQSRDMKTWVHHGPVTEGFSKWVTSAEWVDGKAYIYYDFPNDQDPHVYVDADLTDGEPGKNMGLAVADPSHGSDAGFIRDLDGKMHVIIEDWSPISANKRSWDSPLAGHAVSSNGLNGFKFGPPAVDNRTKPTGKVATYKHPHWMKEDPKRFPSNIAEYEIKRALEPLRGVAAVKIKGGFEEEIHVALNERQIAILGLDINQINSSLAQNNVNLPGGNLREGQVEYLIRTLNEFQSLDEIGSLIVTRQNGVDILLRDIAEIYRAYKDRNIITRMNGVVVLN